MQIYTNTKKGESDEDDAFEEGEEDTVQHIHNNILEMLIYIKWLLCINTEERNDLTSD